LEKYKYDTWRILSVKCYINNSVRLWSCIRNVNTRLVGTLVTLGHVLETCDPCCMLLQLSLPLSLQPMACGEPWDTCQHRSPPLRQVRSRADGRMSVSDPSLAAWQGPMLRDAWQHRTPPGWQGGVQSLWAHGSVGAILGGGEGSRALDMW
jgi:hypothetical protein